MIFRYRNSGEGAIMRTMATLEQLRATADRIMALRDELDSEVERRDDQIVDLVDQGVARRAICEAGRVAPVTICRCLQMAG
jgi:hypothetical protein